MSRHLTILLCTLAVVAGCSRNPERPSAASPTAPSAAAGLPPGSLLGASPVAPGGVSGPMDVSFPGRNESFQFRNELEAIYRDVLRRGTSPTVVDREGEVVWTQEYIRYRVNGCDHVTAVQRVLAQIAGQAAGGVCGAPPDGLILFPGRGDSFLFRGVLESTYVAMGRGQNPSFVDSEGGVIWTQEYLRYRVNACDHATALQKVSSQISGGGVPDTCFVPPACSYTAAPTSQNVPAAGGTFTIAVTRVGSACQWNAESLGSFVTVTSGSGTDSGTVTYTVPPNTGPTRSTQIRVRWLNGSTLVDINQQTGSALNVSILLVDPATASGLPTSVCQIKTAATQCQLIANANLSGTSTFAWTVTYNYPGLITKTQSNTSNAFTFTEQCGGTGSSSGGTDTPMTVRVTVTDPNGTTETVTVVFTIRLFTC